MRINLPNEMKLTCPGCKNAFTVSSSDVDGIQNMGCPFCSVTSPLLDLITPQLRRAIYFKARRHIELLAQNYEKPPSG